ncbi:metallophosphoesterase [Salinarimonas chemoclinalis]|uniref:metallophosphoesterase n=1 Tax=Salinarimonas chemoclinalis TaxID=3241599 RepID=UPI0035591FFE
MRPVACTISRRHVLQAAAVLPLAAALPRGARAAPSVAGDVLLIVMSDLHSPYRRLPAILSAVRAIAAANPGRPMAILINGDVFERGNVAALRSRAAADWMFLEALAREAPVVLNLGNHETAILDDMASLPPEAAARGVALVSNLIDARTGRLFAPAVQRLALGGRRLAVVGLATDNPFVYRQPVRDTLVLVDPVDHAEAALAPLSAGADATVVLSHAGVVADKAILPGLADGTLLVGGHDHLSFEHAAGATRYVHTGSWGAELAVVGIGFAEGADPRIDLAHHAVGVADDADPDLAAAIDAILAEHLTEADRVVIADLDRARDLPESILLATEAVRAAAEADVAFLGHTTFGAPLAAGPLTAYDFDAFVRFDGDIRVAEVDGATLAAMLARANQHRAASLDARTGDFVHAAEIAVDPGARYRVAVNGWTATNQEAYLGTRDIAFVPVEGLALKAVVAEALGRL